MTRCAVVLCACIMLVRLSGVSPAESILTTSPGTGDIPMTIRVETGDQYTQPLVFAKVRRVDSPPQIAFWIEDINGTFIDTLYVSLKAGTQGWSTLPWEKGEIRREYSLPYWAHKRGGGLSGRAVSPHHRGSPAGRRDRRHPDDRFHAENEGAVRSSPVRRNGGVQPAV